MPSPKCKVFCTKCYFSCTYIIPDSSYKVSICKAFKQFMFALNRHYLTEPIICEYNGVQYFDSFVFGLEEKANHLRKEFLACNVLDKAQIKKICQSAKLAFEALSMRDFARVDFRLQKNGKLFFIEINGNPVISKTSEIGVISSELNIPYGEIISNIIRAALKRMDINHA